MSKQTREAKKRRENLRRQIAGLQTRIAAAPNAMAREHFSKQLSEVERQLQRMN